MKLKNLIKIIILTMFACFANTSQAQVVTQVEWWFNNDYTNPQTANITAGSTVFSRDITTETLPAGLHKLNMRVKCVGCSDEFEEYPHSAVTSSYFFKINDANNTCERIFEYWFNNESDNIIREYIGNRRFVTLDLNTHSLNYGYNILNYRIGYADAIMGSVHSHHFLKLNNTSVSAIKTIEYWYNNDFSGVTELSVGNSTTLIDLNLNTGTLNYGYNLLHYRIGYANGYKSSINTHHFFKLNTANLSAALKLEYWFNDDYLYSTHLNINNNSLVEMNLNLQSLPPGINSISFRTHYSDGCFSPVSTSYFMNGKNPYAPEHEGDLTINRYSYWFNNQEATAVLLDTPQSVLMLDTLLIASGLERDKSHSVNLQFRRNDGATSVNVRSAFEFPLPNLHVYNVSASEINHETRTFSVTWSVINDGEAPVVEDWHRDRIWVVPSLERGTTGQGAHLLTSVNNFTKLAPGESYTKSANVTLPGRFWGTYYIIIAADMANVYAINFTPAGDVVPVPYQPNNSGTPYPYLYSNAGINGKTVIEKGENSSRSDNFFYIEIEIPRPPIERFIVATRDSIDFEIVPIGGTCQTSFHVIIQDLDEPLSINITGEDNEVFTYALSHNWHPETGGTITVSFSPDNLKNCNAELVFSADTLQRTIPLKGTGTYPTGVNVTAFVENEIYTSTDDILITGEAKYANDWIAANININISIEVIGYRRIFTVTTDENGLYEYIFKPQQGESGHYRISAFKEGNPNYSVKAVFDIPGMKLAGGDWVAWEVELNIPKSGVIPIMNRSAIPLHGISIETVTNLPYTQFSISSAPVLNGLDIVELNYTVTGTQLTASNNWEEIKLRAVSDEGIIHNFSVWFFCKRSRGVLDVNPYQINTFMTKGFSKVVEFEMTNYGIGETGEISISLPNVEWMELMSLPTLPSLDPNETARVSIRLIPRENTPLNVEFTGHIAINCENGNNVTVPFNIKAVSDNAGDLVVDVVNEYFFHTPGAPHLENAYVVLRHPYAQEITAAGYTGADGVFTVNNIPEGYYTITVDAEGHTGYRNNILIAPSQTNYQNIFISYNAITYTWDVIPTEIEDLYEIELIFEFETNVPMPVVIMTVPSIVPNLMGNEEYTFNVTLTNHGFVAAQDVNITVPLHPDFEFIPLINSFNILNAHESRSIPVLMKRKDAVKAPYYDSQYFNGLISKQPIPCKIAFGGFFIYYCGNDAQWRPLVSNLLRVEDCTETINNPQDIEDWIDDWIEYYENVIGSNPPGGGSNTGGGGPWFPGGGSGGSGGGCNNCGPPAINNTLDGCEPCTKTIPLALIDCIPGLECLASELAPAVYTLLFDYANNQDINLWTHIKDFVLGFGGCLAMEAMEAATGLSFGSCVGGILQAILKCTKIETGKEQQIHVAEDGTTYLYRNINPFQTIQENFEHVEEFINLINSAFLSVFPESEWVNIPKKHEFITLFFNNLTLSGLLNEAGLAYIKSQNTNPAVTNHRINLFAERWNRSVTYWGEGFYETDDVPEGYNTDFITLSSFRLDEINDIQEYYTNIGYVSFNEMVTGSVDYIQNYGAQNSNAVCASVKLQITQRLTMTREAFRGTLTIHNGHEFEPMQNISLELFVKDENGEDSNHFFHIETEKLTTLTAIDGSGILTPTTDGTAVVLFIPTVNAAPTEMKKYSFSGILSYLDPFSGADVSIELFPVTLEVHPSPYLHLYYFMERNIFGDDALTEPVEPSIPAELAVMIDNKGYGVAKNLMIETAQPVILENQSGLLIEFAIIGSNLNGQEVQLGVMDIKFGNLPAQSQVIGQWWFTSSLLGHFTSYETRIRHLDSRGNPDLSLVAGVEIHELIRSINAYGDLNDEISDFLVNDIPDANDYPDAIYFSNATRTNVSVADTAYVDRFATELNPVVNLSVVSSLAGWNFARINDPGQGKFKLISVTRQDNQIIPITNVWQTHCTLPYGGVPIYENKLHFVDTFSVVGLINYTLVFEKINQNPLQVISIEEVPEDVIYSPLERVRIHFNKPIYEPTFTWEDMELRLQGSNNLIDNTVTTTKVNDSTYYVNFAEKTRESGYYQFIIHTNNIYDLEHLPGEYGKSASWTQMLANIVLYESICEGESYDFYDNILTESGVYTETILNDEGQEITVVLILTVNPVYTIPFTISICFGETYDFYGELLSEAGIYSKLFQTVHGCDSTIVLTLKITCGLGFDATLANLTVSEGELVPEFDSEIYFYSVEVSNHISTITIIATPTDPNATVTGEGLKELEIGENIFVITVTSEDEEETLDYTLTINRLLSIKGLTHTNDFIIYPNPATDMLKVVRNVTDKARLEIFTGLGSLVHSVEMNNTEIEINVSGFVSGIYMMRLTNNHGSFVKKFVVRE